MNPKHQRTHIFDKYTSESPIATELRRLYQNLRMSANGSPPKSFLVTSTKRQEGKSTISAYLAITAAESPKRRVLVIDADLRRPTIHRLFGVALEKGLGECLQHGRDLLATVKKTKMSNLDVLTAGDATHAPSLLLDSERLPELLEKAQFYYDVVVVDSAPVVPVSDTLFLCPSVSAVLFVVLAGVTPQDLVVRACDILRDANANVTGVIVNNVSQVLPYYYDYDYYGYPDDVKS